MAWQLISFYHWVIFHWGFPGSVVEKLPASAGDTGSVLGLGISLGEGNGNPFQYSCLGKSHGQSTLAGLRESDTTQGLNNNNNNIPLFGWTTVDLPITYWWTAGWLPNLGSYEWSHYKHLCFRFQEWFPIYGKAAKIVQSIPNIPHSVFLSANILLDKGHLSKVRVG